MIEVKVREQEEEFVKERAKELVEERLQEEVREALGRDDLVRAGAVEIVRHRISRPPSAAVRTAAAFLENMCQYSRFHYLMALCEELAVAADIAYVIEGEESDTVLLLFDLDAADDMLQRVVESPSGGLQLIQQYFDRGGRFALVDRMVPGFDLASLTPMLRREQARDQVRLRSDAHCTALKSYRPLMLEWLVRDGLYSAQLNDSNDAITCGNSLAISMLAAEGRDFNYSNVYGRQALCCPERCVKTVEPLLAAGAKVELLSGKLIPGTRVLRRLLQLRPQETRAKFPGNVLLSADVERWCPVLPYVELMREFDYPAPDVSGIADPDDDIACALFTFDYTSQRPPLPLAEGLMYWRPKTHYAFCEDRQVDVFNVLLCFKRLCPQLPRDIRNMLLVHTYGRTRNFGICCDNEDDDHVHDDEDDSDDSDDEVAEDPEMEDGDEEEEEDSSDN